MDELRPRSETDPDSIARIRSASFPISRRGGYDKRAVERFLDRLADWLESGGGDEVRAEMIRRDLELAGATADALIREAEAKAEQLVAEAEKRVEAAPVATVTPIVRPAHARAGESVDLASARADDLIALGLSRTQALRVIARRDQRGGLESLDELDEVPGIPADLVAEVKARLVLAAPPQRFADAA